MHCNNKFTTKSIYNNNVNAGRMDELIHDKFNFENHNSFEIYKQTTTTTTQSIHQRVTRYIGYMDERFTNT
jgi:hypothetical protein